MPGQVQSVDSPVLSQRTMVEKPVVQIARKTMHQYRGITTFTPLQVSQLQVAHLDRCGLRITRLGLVPDIFGHKTFDETLDLLLRQRGFSDHG